ncbi:MAG: hypothetical protein RBG13Loki_1718 [Promethearchaeota archaeon CR_4]|nr:MAG: hypothetical protein RBG13Loki_1718 [Candidatus Lokiarchaeota archaeon CR_4]
MPKGLVLISWDEYEGAEVAFKEPSDLEIPDPIIQQVQIAHNLISSWMITQEKDFHGLSYYSPAHKYVILVVLDSNEDGQDYRVIVEQINEFLMTKPNPAKIESELKKIYMLTFSVFRARESVMMKLANEVADLKMEQYDLQKNIEVIIKNTRDASTRILLYLAIHEPASFEDLLKQVPVSAPWLRSRLGYLSEQNLIIFKDDKYWIAID